MNSEYIKNNIKSLIDQNYFQNKEELINYLRNINGQELISKEELDKTKNEILNYFDENVKEESKEYNFEEIKANDKDYIKYTNNDGYTTILDDNINEKSLEEQIKIKENKMTDLDKNNQVAEKEIMNEFIKEKVEISLENIDNIELENINIKEQQHLEAMKKSQTNKNDEIIADVQNNIYINNNTGESYTMETNNFESYEVIDAAIKNENKDNLIEQVSIDDVETTKLNNLNDEYNGINLDIYSDFTDQDLQDLINFGSTSLSYQQIEDIKLEIARRIPNNVEEKSNNKVKQKIKENYFNGFSSLLFLSIITGIGGISIFMYILLMIGG